MDKLYIVIPAYNEEENIRTVINDWYPVVERIGGESRLVIIDDGSRDSTFAILNEEEMSRPRLIGITKPNSGHGATVLYGYNYAIEQGADYIFQTDSDGQTLVSEFWSFWRKRKRYDMIIGHRTGRQDGLSRVVVTKVLKLVCLTCFGVFLRDANTPFRLMKAKPLRENMKLVPEDFNLSNVILSVIYAKKQQPVRYVPITFRPRQGGVNSINIKKIIGIGKKAIQDFIEINNSLKTLAKKQV